MKLVKAHAFGNDFLLVSEADLPPGADRAALTRRLCERHRGIGADGLIFFTEEPEGARMHLLNADGSFSEVSGNGVRCLAAWLASARDLRTGESVDDRDRCRSEAAGAAGRRRTALHVSRRDGAARAAAAARDRRRRHARSRPITLRVGNPQCVVLGEVTEERLHAMAARLAVHPAFPEGTNVELAHGRGARSRADPDLGARGRADRGVGHRRLRGGGGRDRLRRRRARRPGRRPGRRAARRVDRRRASSLPAGRRCVFDGRVACRS